MSCVILIASGKGGVGKSTIASALGAALAYMGNDCCVVDADIGLRDQDAILGLENSVVYDLLDVTHKCCALQQALISPPDIPRLKLLPAAQFARVKELDPKAFKKLINKLRNSFQYVLIDCPAGMEQGLRTTLRCEADRIFLVCTPDDICIRNAERLSGLLAEKKLPKPELIVNRIVAELVERKEMPSAAVVAQVLDLPLLGEIPDDVTVYRDLLAHVQLMDTRCAAQAALERIAQRIAGQTVPLPNIGVKKRSWLQRLLGDTYKEVKMIDR